MKGGMSSKYKGQRGIKTELSPVYQSPKFHSQGWVSSQREQGTIPSLSPKVALGTKWVRGVLTWNSKQASTEEQWHKWGLDWMIIMSYDVNGVHL